MPDPTRRDVLRAGLHTGVAGAAAAAGTRASAQTTPTPSEVAGPFYPVVMQKDRDFDLTRVEGRDAAALGTPVWIAGRVIDTDGQPIADATVDLWQANAAGRYRHPHDPNDAPLDPNFQGWAIVPSGDDGGFRFKTIIPGAYPAARGWDRPPHLHFKVTRRGYVELTTQMYFPGEALNDVDRLLLRHPEEDRPRMIARAVDDAEDGTAQLVFDLVLQPA